MDPRPLVWLSAFKTANLAAELQVSMGPRPHLWICAIETACLPQELLVSIRPRPHLCIFANRAASHTSPNGPQTSPVVFAYKLASLAPEYQVYMGPSHYLWFLRAKRRH